MTRTLTPLADDPCTTFWSHVAALAEPGMTFDQSLVHMAQALKIARDLIPLPLPFEPEEPHDLTDKA